MNPYIEKLNAYLAEHSPDYCYQDAHSLLEMFYNFYTEINPIDNSAIQDHYRKLDRYLRCFTAQEQDDLCSIIYNIYAEQERAAFMEGLHIGTRLAMELLNSRTIPRECSRGIIFILRTPQPWSRGSR